MITRMLIVSILAILCLSWTRADGDDPLRVVEDETMLMDGLFEGDIFLGNNKQIEQVADAVYETGPDQPDIDPSRIMNNAIRVDRDPRARWPNGRIPYVLSQRYSSREIGTIKSAMEAFAKETCITFEPARSSDRDYIFIGKGDGCYSMVGRIGGRQDLSLDDGCVYTGTAIHELMHTTGFFHEQSRSDRDDYITVVWDNISRGNYGQFRKLSLREIDLLNTEYDYNSIMHYKEDAFSTNGRPTIIVKRAGARIGNRRYFSDTDITKINRLYDCEETNNFRTPAPTSRPSIVTGTGTSINCRDFSNQCDEYTTDTNCRSSRLIRERCRQSCGLCSGAGSGSTGTRVVTGTGTSGADCRDVIQSCSSFLSLGCNHSLMRQYCAATCAICSGAGGDNSNNNILVSVSNKGGGRRGRGRGRG